MKLRKILFAGTRKLFPTTGTSNMLRQCFVALAASVGLAGCGGRVLQVTRVKPPDSPAMTLDQCHKAEGDPCKLPGIPFYAVGYRCVHTTVWLQPVYAVTMIVTSADNEAAAVAATKFFGRSEFDNQETQHVLAEIEHSPRVADREALNALLNKFQGLHDINPVEFDTTKITTENSNESKEVVLYSNSVAPERYVDASTTFYYNVKKPWAGTTNAEIDLSDEGILHKASGQEETKTMQTILGMFPISELIKAAAGISAMAVPAPPTPKPGKYTVKLQIRSKVYRHTHWVPIAGERPPCSPDASLVGSKGNTPFNFTVEEVTANPSPPAPGSPKAAGKANGTSPRQ